MKKNKYIVGIILIISVIFLGTDLYKRFSYQFSNVFYKYGPTPRLFNDQQIYINTSSNNILSLKENSNIYLSFKNFDKSQVELNIFKVSLTMDIQDRHPSQYSRGIEAFSKDKKCNSIKFNNGGNFLKNYEIKELIGTDCHKNQLNDALIYYGEIKVINNLSKSEIILSSFYEKLLSLTKNYHKFSNHKHKKLKEEEFYTFYFNLDKKIFYNHSNTLFILPTATFFDHLNLEGSFNHTSNFRAKNEYFFLPSNISPIHKKSHMRNEVKLLQKNKMIYAIYLKNNPYINIIYDFELTDNMILDHDIIVFPWHYEYYDKKYSLQNIINKNKDSYKKIIISHSPSNFSREVNFVKDQFNNLLGMEFTYNENEYKIVSARKKCKFISDLKLDKRVSEIEGYTLLEEKNNQINWDTNDTFFNFKCETTNDTLHPLINKKKINNITLLEFNNALAGRSILRSSILENFFTETLREN